ncbi:MAG TPA: hypothetical protein VJZ04_06235 [Lachnospiraceae bacterium]|nr:hypothetical protein [Lachnospiraceae bacterium]
MGRIKKVIASTYIFDYGQMVEAFQLSLEGFSEVELESVCAKSFTIENNFKDLTGKVLSKGVISVDVNKNEKETQIVLRLDPFVFRYDFVVKYKCGVEDISFNKNDIKDVKIKDLDKFKPYSENGVNYRMHEPEVTGSRPLVLFLHGGGECGEDNIQSLTGTLGAMRLAERWSDMYIMAPQAPSGNMDINEMFELMKKRGNPFCVDMGITPFSLKGERGWNRDYLGKVCSIIQNMITDGKVDAKRVYVIGMSMGGGGVLNAVSVAPSLFAAAVPICPSMNGESFAELLNLPEVPVWIATAYIDHQIGRHAYILEACNKLWKEGRNDVKFTLFKPEELKAYGIGTTEGLTTKELYEENHYSWILVLHNEHGMLDWMISHVKK